MIPANGSPSLHQKVQCRSFCLAPNSPSSNICQLETKPTVLVTNRWNRRHLSWIFFKFLSFTLHTFVLTQMYPSPSPMVSHAYFGALRWLQYPNQHWERGKSHKCFKICDEYCRRYLDRCNYPLQTGPAQKGTPFPLSAYVQQCWRRRISSPGRTSLAGTALVTRSSESLCQESCYYRKLKYLLSDPASSLRNHPMYLRIHLSYITYQGSTSNRRIFRRRYRNTSLSHSYFHICLRFRVWNKSRPLRSLTSATTAWLPRESHLHWLRQESVVPHNSYSSLFLYPFHITRHSIQPFYVVISKLHETYAHYFHPLRPLF